jgi:hypothetical protein
LCRSRRGLPRAETRNDRDLGRQAYVLYMLNVVVENASAGALMTLGIAALALHHSLQTTATRRNTLKC